MSSLPAPPSQKTHPPFSHKKRNRRKTKIVVLIISLIVFALIAAGSAFAFMKLKTSSDYPFNHLASGAIVYGQVNLDPSAEQKLSVNSLMKKFPEAKKEEPYKVFTADNINAAIIKSISESEEEFEWVGDRIAFAAYPDSNNDGEPEIALLIETNDYSAAKNDLSILVDDFNEVESKGVSTGGIDWEEENPYVFTGAIYDEKWVGITTGDVEKVFESNDTLDNDKKFVQNFNDNKGNIFSTWIDLERVSNAYEASTDEEVKIEGIINIDVKVRDNGVDLTTKSTGLLIDDSAILSKGNASKSTKQLENNSYENATLNLAIAGFGDTMKELFEEWGVEYDDMFNPNDLPKLLGDSFSLSVEGDRLEKLNGTLILSGIDETVWENYLDDYDLSLNEIEREASRSGFDLELNLDSEELRVTLGKPASDSNKFDEGAIIGELNIDSIYNIFNTLFDPDSDDETDYGIISFYGGSSNDGDGEFIFSWTTPR